MTTIKASMTLAEYYNKEVREHGDTYSVDMYEHEFDYELRKLTMGGFGRAVNKFITDENFCQYDLPDRESKVFAAIFSIDTECRHVFWRLARAIIRGEAKIVK
jgi:hypothetical protein